MVRLAVVVLLLCAACTPADPAPTQVSETLHIMAAASLTAAFLEIGEAFEEAHPGVEVELNFAGSQQLAYQVIQGAPADVFASANREEMDKLNEAGLIDPPSVQVFARNHLIVVFPQGNPAGIARLQDLANPGIKLVLATAETPVGSYTLELLERLAQQADFPDDFKDAVLLNVVSYETNVRTVAAKVSLGEADAGIVYVSDASSAADSGESLEVLEVPAESNVTAEYPIGVIAGSPRSGLAGEFIDLVLSGEGQAVLEKNGFIPAKP